MVSSLEDKPEKKRKGTLSHMNWLRKNHLSKYVTETNIKRGVKFSV